ncbi:MAG TPA: DNA photolyase [bacterium]|nr:DNA photolyase [bacterium]
MKPPFRTILVDETIRHHFLTNRLLSHAGGVRVVYADSECLDEIIQEQTLSYGKRMLHLSSPRGELVKPCPGTRKPYLCCRYTVINQVRQCPMDCSYCILQDYLSSPVTTLLIPLDPVWEEVDRMQKQEPERFFRFGTGELGDSLALDPWTSLSSEFMQYFAGRRNCLIEFKTKSDRIENAIKNPASNAVMSWSLNPPGIILDEEKGSASLERRLQAAKRCQDAGLLLGFHFDPLCFFTGWESKYKKLVRTLFDYVRPDRIAWISLGSLRYPPSLKNVSLKRFPRTSLFYHEMIRGLDGKMRYPRPMRIRLYRSLERIIRHHAKDIFLYFCMEPPWVWKAVLGAAPDGNAHLDYLFAENLYRRFPEIEMDEPKRERYG